mgnify:CR=1 FL=1
MRGCFAKEETWPWSCASRARTCCRAPGSSWETLPQRQAVELVGDRGWAALDVERGTLRIGLAEGAAESEEQVHAVRDDMYRQEHQAFLDAIDGKRPLASPAADALVSMEIIDAALTSWKTGERIPLAGAARQGRRPAGPAAAL